MQDFNRLQALTENAWRRIDDPETIGFIIFYGQQKFFSGLRWGILVGITSAFIALFLAHTH